MALKEKEIEEAKIYLNECELRLAGFIKQNETVLNELKGLKKDVREANKQVAELYEEFYEENKEEL